MPFKKKRKTSSEGTGTPKRSLKKRENRKTTVTTGGKKGWAKLKQVDEQIKSQKDRLPEFWLKTGEMSFVQFLDDEPFIFQSHNIKVNGKFTSEVCQLEGSTRCVICEAGLKATNKAAFRILDYRGSWDKDAKDFTWDEPREMYWIMSTPIAMQLMEYQERKSRPLTELVIEVSRSGSGTSTRYNLGPALDDDDNVVQPLDIEPALDECEAAIQPKTDDELIKLGFSELDD